MVGQRETLALSVQQPEKIELAAVIWARRIARGRTDAAMLLAEECFQIGIARVRVTPVVTRLRVQPRVGRRFEPVVLI